MTNSLQLQFLRELENLESALRTLQMWEELPPSMEALQSQEPFCVDTLSFEQWLQWVFILKMKWLIENDHPLPQKSELLPMAEVSFEQREGIEPLLKVIESLDKLFE